MRSIPPSWQPVLQHEVAQPYYQQLTAFLDEERAAHAIYPPEDEVFAALSLTAYQDASVLILGQDPYHGTGQAHGLAFSVRPGITPPPSLVNIFKELKTDLGLRVPNNGFLVPWAEQGVLLLNTALTVRAHQANSHKGRGWERFTDAVIAALSARTEPAVFVLWGGNAHKKLKLIDESRHVVIQSAHPSPLSARTGFFGSRPFSRINAALAEFGRPQIDWQLPTL
ncbi:MAG: uracil-DNA glycosylase [Roseiflexaceae bacterium]|nr:uracil-DNA glycosylase [Roseiflexaceae bacterium]